jgi:hypothetical protein
MPEETRVRNLDMDSVRVIVDEPGQIEFSGKAMDKRPESDSLNRTVYSNPLSSACV